jgi:hypothetical protein
MHIAGPSSPGAHKIGITKEKDDKWNYPQVEHRQSTFILIWIMGGISCGWLGRSHGLNRRLRANTAITTLFGIIIPVIIRMVVERRTVMNYAMKFKSPTWSATYQWELIKNAVARDLAGWEIADTYWMGDGKPMRVTLRDTRPGGTVEFFEINLETLKLDSLT